jgi:uncharacterized protein
MRFKINEIGAEGLPVNVTVTADWVAAACPDLEARPVPSGLVLRGRLDKTGDDYLLRADLRGEMETTCARCLEPARLALSLPFAVTFVSADEDDDVDDDADPDLVTFEGGEIDVGDEVRDEILLAIPINPLCKEACLGLCLVCGGNRNVVACACKTETAPTGRLAALAKIKLPTQQ